MAGNNSSANPSVTRLPTQQDPSLRAAQLRAQEAARKRTGRLSTVLTDGLRGLVGTAGKLGS